MPVRKIPMPLRRPDSVMPVFAMAGLLFGGLPCPSAVGAQGASGGDGLVLKLDGALRHGPPGGDDLALKPDGDLGAAAYYTRSIIRGKSESALILPYANIDYGRLFARIDTLGVKTLKLAYGYLEIAGRVELDGFKADTASLRGLDSRRDSIPLGFSTLQETPVGAWYLNAFHDVAKSAGNLADVTYVVSVASGRVTVYPQIGVEYLSRRYVDYYYGISPRESLTSRYGYYRPGAALDPYVAALIEIRATERWNVNVLLRQKWLAGSIADSPIVDRRGASNMFVSFAYRFM